MGMLLAISVIYRIYLSLVVKFGAICIYICTFIFRFIFTHIYIYAIASMYGILTCIYYMDGMGIYTRIYKYSSVDFGFHDYNGWL